MEYIGKCSSLSLLKETSKTSNLDLYLIYTWLYLIMLLFILSAWSIDQAGCLFIILGKRKATNAKETLGRADPVV